MLLCTLYLMATGSVSLVSLLCPCNASHQHTSCCHHHAVELQATGAYEAPCCDDLHATEVTLYTGDRENDPRRNLNLQLLAEASVELLDGFLQEPRSCNDLLRWEFAPPIADRAVGSCALRAPPYTV